MKSRRRFIKYGVASAAGLALGNRVAAQRVLSADEFESGKSPEMRIGLIGCGTQGRRHSERLRSRITDVCDVDESQFSSVDAVIRTAPRRYKDYVELIRNVDAVVIATPDHWHAKMLMDAIALGKHAYVELPLCATIGEASLLMKAMQESKVAIQLGHKSLLNLNYLLSKAFIAEGHIGRTNRIDLWAPPNRQIPLKPTSPDLTLDWNSWLGPAPDRDFSEGLHPNGFRLIWDLGGGDIRGRGSYVFALILGVLNIEFIEAATVSVEVLDANPARETVACCSEKLRGTILLQPANIELRWHQDGQKFHHFDFGCVFRGSKDDMIMFGGDLGVGVEDKVAQFAVSRKDTAPLMTGDLMEEWLLDIKDRKRPHIVNASHIHYATVLSHLMNISAITGEKIEATFDGANVKMKPEMAELTRPFSREHWKVRKEPV